MSLTALPVELYLQILEDTPLSGLRSLTLTCRKLRPLADEEMYSRGIAADKVRGMPFALADAAVSNQIRPFKALLDRTELRFLMRPTFDKTRRLPSRLESLPKENPRIYHSGGLIHFVSMLGREEMVKLVLEKYAESSERYGYQTPYQLIYDNSPYYTPFLCAVRAGHVGVMRLLLDAGASVNETVRTPNQFQERAIDIAVSCHQAAAVKLLLDEGVDVTLLALARVSNADRDIAQLLVEAGPVMIEKAIAASTQREPDRVLPSIGYLKLFLRDRGEILG
ncbi:hypothetical protein FQN57_005116 [Myotisia sp. PD_48]|nr:hypothetical protein FQN57_005116 [Myotisia sp. PD_48]